MRSEKKDDSRHHETVALFRYGLIADLLNVDRRGLYKKLHEKAARDYDIPGSTRRRVAPETLRGWLRDYRRGGFDALVPKPRCDNGLTRAIPGAIADLLVETKDKNRALSVPLLIDEVRRTGKISAELTLAPATVHRLLAQHGLNRPTPSDNSPKDRRHFAFEKAGELWMSDVMHGPSVPLTDKRKKKAYLIGFLDDATRIVPYAAFASSENTAAFLPVFEQAIMRRGIPKRLYVDNGSAYRSHHLAIVCAKLGVTLIHARPYQPQGKGKQERFFRTVRMQFLAALSPAALTSLDALNRSFWAWVEGEYHQAPHRGLDGECPADRWARNSDEVRLAGGELSDLFLFEQKRKVQKDRTVSLDGVLYEVDASLVGDTVTLRYDPSRTRKPVQIWHRGQQVQIAKPVDAYSNCFVRRDRHRSDLVAPAIPVSSIKLAGLFDEGGK
jgi:transposase InsO family protein